MKYTPKLEAQKLYKRQTMYFIGHVREAAIGR